MSLYRLTRGLLSLPPPETARNLLLGAMAMGFGPPRVASLPHQSSNLFGVPMPNSVGLPAGFVKDANPHVLGALFRWGVGFIEVGSVTPLPRPGNSKPRHWRFGPGGAVNFYGLNGPGLDKVVENLIRFYQVYGKHHVVGASLANPPSLEVPYPPVSNFQRMAQRLALLVSFFVINRGCPNTGEPIDNDLDSFKAELGATLLGAGGKPVYVKFAPFIGEAQLAQLVTLVKVGLEMGVTGFICCNTLTHAQAVEHHLFDLNLLKQWPRKLNAEAAMLPVGGASGPVLLPIAERMIRTIRGAVPASVPIIGVGGVNTGDTGLRLRRAGANAIQAYTGFAHNARLLEDLLAA